MAVEMKGFTRKQKLIPKESVNDDRLFLFLSFVAMHNLTQKKPYDSFLSFCVFLWQNLAFVRFCFRVPLFSGREALWKQWRKSSFSLQTIISVIMTLDGHVSPLLPGQQCGKKCN